MKKIHIGVIGCGAMGMSIVRRILALSPELEVAALFDPDFRSIESALKELSNRPVVYSTYEELLADTEISWVMIASWNSQHCKQTLDAFEAGKHVFCQKPLGIELSECVAMHQAWLRSGRMFNIGFTLRYSPHYRKIKQLIDADHIGKIISMEFNETLDFNHGGYIMGDWRRLQKNAGTHLLEKCSHDIDLCNWMMGSRATRVASFGGLDFFTPKNEGAMERIGRSSDGKMAYQSWPGLVNLNPFTSDKDILDNQIGLIEYANGARATFHTNCNAAIPERRMYILGSEGAIRADVLTGKIELKRIGFETPLEDVSTDSGGGHGNGDEYLARELANSMVHEIPPLVSMLEGLESSVVCFAMDDARTLGAVLEVAPYWEEADQSILRTGPKLAVIS